MQEEIVRDIEFVDEKAIDKTSAVYFTVAPSKLLVMTIMTFGIYEFVWFYKNWKIYKKSENSSISPFWRTVFSGIFAWSLFTKMNYDAVFNELKPKYNPKVLGALYLFLSLLYRLPDQYWLISLFSIIPIAIMQKTLHEINIKHNFKKYYTSQYSKWNIVFIIIGIAWWALVLYGFYVE